MPARPALPAEAIAPYALAMKVKPELLWKMLWVCYELTRRKIPYTVTSMHRSSEHQAALRARWDRGDRAGLVTQPALPGTSRHERGEAFDISVPVQYRAEYGKIVEGEGLRWGGRWKSPDYVHGELW